MAAVANSAGAPVAGVRVRSLRKAFAARKDVLSAIDLDLLPGEIVGLIGPNGAGKTTLTSCLLGFLRPDEGEISFDGLRNTELGIRQRTGYVPERLSLGTRITGWQFLRYMGRLSGIPRTDIRRRGMMMLERLGLTQAADEPLGHYSRGMLQRIALCQALIHEPDFLFLDEPTSGLDPNGVLLVRDLIREQAQRGAMVLLNSHQLAEIEKVCDRVLLLRGGRINRMETLRQTGRTVMAIRLLRGSFDREAVERITGGRLDDDTIIVSRESEAEIAAIVRELVVSGADLVEVRPHTTDLESIFRSGS
jgi:ABC-2 type transport system ATP-binding protein